MKRTCTLDTAKALFKSKDESPTEQYLHSDYDYIPGQVHVEEASSLFQENIECSSFMANMTYVEH
eukprot:7073477-Ditylum_brightwellii.AAC.1